MHRALTHPCNLTWTGLNTDLEARVPDSQSQSLGSVPGPGIVQHWCAGVCTSRVSVGWCGPVKCVPFGAPGWGMDLYAITAWAQGYRRHPTLKGFIVSLHTGP